MKSISLGVLLSALLLVSFTQQVIKTKLKVQVVTKKGELVEGATLRVFDNVQDYNSEKNAIAEVITDENGFCKVSDLEDRAYYVIAEKGELSNLFNSDRTKVLDKGKTNKIIIIIE